MKVNLNDRLVLKKGHPCGSNDWKVIRVGADVKLECMGCGRNILIDRPTLLKRIKKITNSES